MSPGNIKCKESFPNYDSNRNELFFCNIWQSNKCELIGIIFRHWSLFSIESINQFGVLNVNGIWDKNLVK